MNEYEYIPTYIHMYEYVVGRFYLCQRRSFECVANLEQTAKRNSS